MGDTLADPWAGVLEGEQPIQAPSPYSPMVMPTPKEAPPAASAPGDYGLENEQPYTPPAAQEGPHSNKASGYFPSMAAGLSEGIGSAADWMARHTFRNPLVTGLAGLGGKQVNQEEIPPEQRAGPQEATRPTIGGYTPENVEPQGWGQRAAFQAAAALPTAPIFGGGVGGIAKTLLGAAGGSLGSDYLSENRPSWMPDWAARLAGSAVGGIAGANAPSMLRAPVNAGIRAALMPSAAEEPALGPMLQAAQEQGFTPTVANVTNSEFAKGAEKMLRVVPGAAGFKSGDQEFQGLINKRSNELMNVPEAAAAAAGVPHDKAQFALARQRNGQIIDQAESTGAIDFGGNSPSGQQLIDRLATIHSNSADELGDNNAVQKAIDRIWNLAVTRNNSSNVPAPPTNSIPFSSLHQTSEVDRLLGSTNSEIRKYAGQVNSALKDALHQNLPPDQAAAYHQARIGWANMKALEPSAGMADTAAGAHPSTGDIDPNHIRGLTNRAFGRDIAARAEPGEYGLNDLAQFTQRMKQNRSSMTGEHNIITHLGAGLVGGMGHLASGAAAVDAAVTGGASMAGLAGGARMAGSLLRTPALPQSPMSVLGGNAGPTLGGIAAPLTNPQTGQQQFNLRDAQHLDLGLAKGLHGSGANYRDWVTDNLHAIRKQYSGKGIERAHQIGSALNRGPTKIVSHAAKELDAGEGSFHDQLKKAGVGSTHEMIHHALVHPEFARVIMEDHPEGQPADQRLGRFLAKARAG